MNLRVSRPDPCGRRAMLETREGGCHCGEVRFRAEVDLDRLSWWSCTICTKKGIVHLPVSPDEFQLLRGRNALKVFTFQTGVAQHTFCGHCGMHPFYIPRSSSRPAERERAVSRRHRPRYLEADPVLRWQALGRGAGKADRRRGPRAAAGPQRRRNAARHSGSGAGIVSIYPARSSPDPG